MYSFFHAKLNCKTEKNENKIDAVRKRWMNLLASAVTNTPPLTNGSNPNQNCNHQATTTLNVPMQ